MLCDSSMKIAQFMRPTPALRLSYMKENNEKGKYNGC